MPILIKNMPKIDLSKFNNSNWHRGRSFVVEIFWISISSLFVNSWIPGSAHRKYILKLFGAKISAGVVFKPYLKVKFPWRLEIRTNAWIGESVWIDNLAKVQIEENACISQGVYLCTGSHDWSSATFDLIVEPITICEGAWVAANSTVGPGVTIGEGAVLGLASMTSKDLLAWTVYSGCPAKPIKDRIIRNT